MSLEFPIIKLLDFDSRIDELEQQENPFAIVVLAHLRTLMTRRDMDLRLQWKLELAKALYRRGYPRKSIVNLFRFIEWVMTLPPELDNIFWDDLQQFTQENNMPYLMKLEREAQERGMQQGMQQGRKALQDVLLRTLSLRFKRVPRTVKSALNKITSLEQLTALHEVALMAASMNEFLIALDQQQ